MTAGDRATAAVAYWESLQPRGMQFGLERMERWMELLGHPERKLRCIHVAGTNGKGSTARMIQCILSEAGYRTGLYASPAVTGLLDTITIDGKPIPPEAFAELTSELRRSEPQLQPVGGSSQFEGVTALALLWFARQGVDVAVVECGLGGREDATNIIEPPLAAVITPISYDHTAVLGPTLAAIASRKCGIIKPPCLVVTSALQDARALNVIYETATRLGLTVRQPHMGSLSNFETALGHTAFSYGGGQYSTGQLVPHMPLSGFHQCDNALVAIETVRALGVYGMVLSDNFLTEGLARAALACRQEVVRRDPLVLVDGAHNVASFGALTKLLRSEREAGRLPDPLTAVVGMLSDKDATACMAMLAPYCRAMVCCTPEGPRGLPGDQLAAIVRNVAPDLPVTVADTPADAWRQARLQPGPLLVTGSFYVAAAVRPLALDDAK